MVVVAALFVPKLAPSAAAAMAIRTQAQRTTTKKKVGSSRSSPWQHTKSPGDLPGLAPI
jgi:hypothetical protein